MIAKPRNCVWQILAVLILTIGRGTWARNNNPRVPLDGLVSFWDFTGPFVAKLGTGQHGEVTQAI